jgi:hypothetical protein
MGIEPTLSGWEPEVLPLNYTRQIPWKWTHFSPEGEEYHPSPRGFKSKTYLATGHHVEVCTLSGRGNRFIPYPHHYSRAFAFSTILYPLEHESLLQETLSQVLHN